MGPHWRAPSGAGAHESELHPQTRSTPRVRIAGGDDQRPEHPRQHALRRHLLQRGRQSRRAARELHALLASFTPAAVASYRFVLDGPSFTNSLPWDSLSPNVAPTDAAGFTFDGCRFSSNGGGAWGSSSTYNGVTINAVIPAPAALGLLGAAGLVGSRRRR
ncbi:MAG TPA: hypothetical protein VFF69_08640 [Phycisphaerales bacterium]|nr:hypothetical protein [Phycisphaerales bacterium]